MTMYATKVWGFASADWPVITFSREGVRNRLASLWKPGDTMLLIGTQQEPTAPSDRGKMLGYLEFTSVPVLTRNIVAQEILAVHGDKWPYALLCTQSWEFEESPLFKEFFPDLAARYPGMTLASNFAILTAEEEQRVRSLRTSHRVLPKNDAAQLAADKTAAIQQIHGGGRGPIAFTGSYTVTKTSSPAQTYLLKLKGYDLMKIGWAYNPDARAKKLSESLVPSFTDMRWEVVQFHRWPNEYAARFMEQAMLGVKVSDMNALGNEVVITNAALVRKLPFLVAEYRAAPSGTIIFPKRGAAIATNKKRLTSTWTVFDPNIIGVIAREKLDQKYFFHWFQNFDLRTITEPGPTPQLNKKNLDPLLVPVPPTLDEQLEIASILDAIDRKIDLHKRKKAVLEELFKSLLHKLMTGEIRVSDLDLTAIQAGGH